MCASNATTSGGLSSVVASGNFRRAVKAAEGELAKAKRSVGVRQRDLEALKRRRAEAERRA